MILSTSDKTQYYCTSTPPRKTITHCHICSCHKYHKAMFSDFWNLPSESPSPALHLYIGPTGGGQQSLNNILHGVEMLTESVDCWLPSLAPPGYGAVIGRQETPWAGTMQMYNQVKTLCTAELSWPILPHVTSSLTTFEKPASPWEPEWSTGSHGECVGGTTTDISEFAHHPSQQMSPTSF